ncbi:MAG: RNA polymerase sigma factor [Woeseiaceae bacterium]
MGQATLTATPTTTDDETVDDTELLNEIAAGNKAAFEAFYRRYYRRVSQFVYRLTPDRQLGEEIVDDTMLVVWRSAGKFAGRSKVSTWVLGIAYRRAMKALDREKKHRSADHDETILEMQPDGDAARDPLAMAAANTIQRQLGVFVDKLHINQQVALHLTALGHSYPEISVIVGCPANTVKTRVFKARHKLKGYLSDAGIRL